MSTTQPDLDIDLSGLPAEEWCQSLDRMVEDEGHFEFLGDHHASLFLDRGRQLLVTFEQREVAQKSPKGQPMGFRLLRQNDWSLLAFFSCGETWFRDPRVWKTFDRLTDDGFFEDFERVLFYGAAGNGYAAAAFSVAAPGAHVLAVRPQATLDPAVTGWDRRFLGQRRMDFTSRYGFAPEMIDGAMKAWVVQDPTQTLDAMHAALFTRPNVTSLRCPMAGRTTERTLESLGILDPMIEAAMAGTLDRLSFARLWRARRQAPAYLRGLSKRLEAEGRAGLLEHLCNYGVTTRDRAFFENRLAALNAVAGAAE